MNLYPLLSATLFVASLLLPTPAEPEPVIAPAQIPPMVDVAPSPQLPPIPFHVVMQSQGFPPGTPLTISNTSGAFSSQGEWFCPLTAGYYMVCVDDKYVTQFSLEENAAITNVVGCGWSDGEVLHLEPGIQWVILVKDAPLGTYVLTNGQAQWELYGAGTLAFPDLTPGTYTLILPDRTSRVVTLTKQMPQVTLGLA